MFFLVGVVGFFVIDGQSYFIFMVIIEGVLVVSVSRGCKVINFGGGVVIVFIVDGMICGFCVSFEMFERVGYVKFWFDFEKGQNVMKKVFNFISCFVCFEIMKIVIVGMNLYICFKIIIGDVMGMNMIFKGVEYVFSVMCNEGFEDMNIVIVSGNYCIDKKFVVINWIEGCGKSVVVEVIIFVEVVKSVLKIDVDIMVVFNVDKNLIGFVMVGFVGGFNVYVVNIVVVIFFVIGQDFVQVVESVNCIIIMKK